MPSNHIHSIYPLKKKNYPLKKKKCAQIWGTLLSRQHVIPTKHLMFQPCSFMGGVSAQVCWTTLSTAIASSVFYWMLKMSFVCLYKDSTIFNSHLILKNLYVFCRMDKKINFVYRKQGLVQKWSNLVLPLVMRHCMGFGLTQLYSPEWQSQKHDFS